MTSRDRVFFERAYELAARGVGSTSPNPPVGAVFVRDGSIIGEGYHHRAGEAHAEVHALRQAGNARGATAFVTLEPCNHVGRTPACSRALIDAGVARVVVGTTDPNPKTNGGGIAALRAAGIAVDILDDPRSSRLIEPFTFSVRHERSYVALKMAMSLDGYVGIGRERRQLTGEDWRLRVRELRIEHDAVMVGAGTIRVDDPELTVRPPSHRLHPFARVVACETDSVPAVSRVFEQAEDYDRTIVLAPRGARERFTELERVADVIYVGDDAATTLDLALAMRATRQAGIQSILCEGGPTLGARLIAAGLVERFYWAIAPHFLAAPEAVPVLNGAELATLPPMRFDHCEPVGKDMMLSGVFERV